MGERPDEKARGSHAGHWLLVGVMSLVVACTIVMLSPMGQAAQVSHLAEQRAVAFGWPFHWVTQDQSSLDTPLPDDVSLISPWEHPVSVRWANLMLDVTVLWVALYAAGFVASRGLRRRRPTVPLERQPA
ncbi:MAG: hypothetical protein JWO11_2612 [Nocardioides sp.]|nr:hypothetical protein [Nocardioides sp.]